MNLLNKFDHAVKAQSTTEQWEQYLEELIKLNEDRPMKYRVQTDVLEDMGKGDEISDSWRDRMIQEGCPESWFEPIEQVEEGQYWKWNGENEYMFRIQNVHSETQKCDILYPRTGVEKQWYINGITEDARKLSTDEIEQALIKEAKRRGYTKNRFKCISGCQVDIDINEFSYHKDVDALYYAANACYVQGDWAEIIDQPIKINGKQIEVENGQVKISCGDTIYEEMFKNFYAVVNKYDLNVSRNGEQINEQLQQIREEMPSKVAGESVEWTIEVSGDDIFKANSRGRMRL